MRSNQLWIGVTCGVALALGGLAAMDAGTQTAGALEYTTPICQYDGTGILVPGPSDEENCPAAVPWRNGVRAPDVDSVTPSPGTAGRSKPGKDVHPFTVSIDQHVIDQKIARAGVRRSPAVWASLDYMANPTPRVTVRDQSGPIGSVTSSRNGMGDYKVVFLKTTDVSKCRWSASPSNAELGGLPFLTAVTAPVENTATPDPDDWMKTQVRVGVFEAGALADHDVIVQVFC